MSKVGENAVVLGASMAGLVAASVLTEFYETVTIVERDELPDDPAPRRGVPQGRHAHALLRGGSDALERLFPSFLAELAAAGGTVIDDGDLSKACYVFGGREFNRSGKFADPHAAAHHVVTRPFLEAHVRRRLRALPNLTMLDGHDVVELTAHRPGRVTGAKVAHRASGEQHALSADLVVDAMGRGSRTPVFLDRLGYGRPEEESLVVSVCYVSQLLRLPPGLVDEEVFLIGPSPERPTGGALLHSENDVWMATVAGLMGHEPPTDRDGVLKFAEAFAPPPMLKGMRVGEPITELTRYRYPSTQWRRYDKMSHFPAGLLVFGDALCSFNPVYGQGMTISALQAAVLGECLRHGDHDLSRRFFRAAAKPVKTAWKMAKTSDLALPGVQAKRPPSARLMNLYTEHVLTAAELDPKVTEQFLAVFNLVAPPARLFHPAFMFRVARAAILDRRHTKHTTQTEGPASSRGRVATAGRRRG